MRVVLYVDDAIQKYNNMPNEQNNFKGIILEFLDYLRYKIENDRMTMEDMESLARTMESNLDLCAVRLMTSHGSMASPRPMLQRS